MVLLLFTLLVLLTMVPYLVAQDTTNEYILNPLIPFLKSGNLFETPYKITYADSTTANNNIQFNPAKIAYFNYFAVSSYCLGELENLSCIHCQKFKNDVSKVIVLTNSSTDTLAFIVVQPKQKQIVVTFQGSSNVVNHIQDFTFLEVNVGRNIKIHRGFYIATMSLYKKIVSTLQLELDLHPGFEVVVVGHSLGASMASITIYFVKSLHQFPGVNFSLITFGQPRTGNKGFAEYMKTIPIPMVRVTNRAELVAHLPPVNLVVGDYFLHHQTEYWINGTGRFCSDLTMEDPTCSDSMGPAYTELDHMYYLDVDYTVCVYNPIAFLSVPYVLNTQIKNLPILPTYVFPPGRAASVYSNVHAFQPTLGK